MDWISAKCFKGPRERRPLKMKRLVEDFGEGSMPAQPKCPRLDPAADKLGDLEHPSACNYKMAQASV